MNHLRKFLDSIIDLYVDEFCEKHDCYLEYWIADDKTGIACFGGEYFFNLGDIVYDIDNECPVMEIFHWQDHEVEKAMDNENCKKVNFKSYLMGLR